MEQFSPSLHSAFQRMWRLGYGTFRDVQVRDGELVLDPPCTVVRTARFSETAVPGRSVPEFRLRREHAAFQAELQKIGTGRIDLIKIHDGLPMSLEITEQL